MLVTTIYRYLYLTTIFCACKGGQIIFLHNNLKYLKDKSGLTWKEIGIKANIKLRTLEDIVAGRTLYPRIDTIDALAKFFNVSIDDLINKDLCKNN